MEKLASFIVDKRNLFFLLYIFALIFSAIATGWVKVEDDITTYLPDTTETRQGLTVMNDNFVTYGTANVMVSNITYDTALDIQSRLEDIEGVTTVEFDDTDEHYTNASALFSVSFDAEVGDERAENALQEIRDELEGSYDTSIYSEVGYDSSADLQSEMLVIVIIAAIIIVVVLTLTSRSYAEVPVLLMTFGAAALLNMGTNFLCGTISFISNSVTVILQLALAIDYAIILCHRFSDEHETLPTREACIAALSKAIPEISSSSLTTISGLAALAFMHFGIGRDLATVLIKAILFSMLCVFTLMPGLLVLFSKLIDKTRHKNLIPKITAVGKFDIKTRRSSASSSWRRRSLPTCAPTATPTPTWSPPSRASARSPTRKSKTPSVPATWWPSLCRRATMSPRAGSSTSWTPAPRSNPRWVWPTLKRWTAIC